MKCRENMILHEIFRVVGITFSPLHFMLYHGKSISSGTVYIGGVYLEQESVPKTQHTWFNFSMPLNRKTHFRKKRERKDHSTAAAINSIRIREEAK